MYNREELHDAVARCLSYPAEEAAQRHIARETNDWNLSFGYWPLNLSYENIRPAVDEISRALGAQIIRRNMTEQIVEIDACSIGYQQLYLEEKTIRLRRGVGLWLPVKVDLTTEVE